MSPSVLVVEDEVVIARDIQRTLLDLGYRVPVIAMNGFEAVDAVEAVRPDLILMDIRLGGTLDGIQTAAKVREKYEIPIVYVSAYSDEATLARAKETGPYGYVVKPFDDRDLRTTIEVALRRFELECTAIADAERVANASRAVAARNEKRLREAERLLAAACTDPLTDAANRMHLQADLERCADRARRYGHQYCLAFCDVDELKSYNDSFGHLAGDNAIRQVSHAIQGQLRLSDRFYRYGGDEFLVLLPEQSVSRAQECMERVRRTVASIASLPNEGAVARPLTISVGVAAFRPAAEGDAIQWWLERADAALYRAKARGRNLVETDALAEEDS